MLVLCGGLRSYAGELFDVMHWKSSVELGLGQEIIRTHTRRYWLWQTICVLQSYMNLQFTLEIKENKSNKSKFMVKKM